MNPLLLLVVGGGLWWFLKKGSASKQMKWSITGIDFKKAQINVELINPTNTPLNFKAFVADLIVKNQTVGTLDYRQVTTLAALDRKTLKIPVRFNPIGLLLLAKAFYQGGLKGLTLTVTGTINAENISAPFTQTIPLS